MPHELPDPNDYQEQQARILAAQQAETARIFTICNAGLRCAIKCPLPNRTAADCADCGNADCITAKQSLDDLWRDK